MKKFLFITMLTTIIVVSIRCKPHFGKDPEFQFEKGFGRSKERPIGTPFSWPAGIRVLDKITTNEDCYYESVDKKRVFGHGDLQICLNLYNETQVPITVKLPPGFMFISTSLQVQNMLLVNTVTIMVPPQVQFFTTLTMLCVNEDRNSPYHDEYEDQPIVTSHPALRDLTETIKNKKCNYEDYGGNSRDPEAFQASTLINSAVKNLIYGKPVSGEIMKELMALPDK